jgi:hypothetical protein
LLHSLKITLFSSTSHVRALGADRFDRGPESTLGGKGKKGTTSYDVNLSWSQVTSGPTAVTTDHIYRATGTSNFSLISSSSPTIESYTDSNVTHGTTYTYYVIGGNSAGMSPASNTFTVTP